MPPVLAAPVASVLAADAAKTGRAFLTPQPVDLTTPLTPNALAVLAVLGNPDLKAQRAKAGVAEAQSFAARLLPDPTLGLGVDHILSGPDHLDPLLAQLGFDLQALRTRRVSQQAAAATAQQVRLDLAWAEWQAAGAARLQGVRILGLTRTLALAQASAGSANDLLAHTLAAAGRGDIAGTEAETRRIAALDASDKLRTAERDLSAAQFELNRLLGLPPQTVLRLAEINEWLPSLDPEALFAFARTSRLDLQALTAGYAAQEAVVHKAVLDQFPTLALSINGARDNTDNRSIGPSLSFTLPLWNRNRGGIAVAQATRAQLKAEYETRLFQTRAEIASAVAVLTTADRQQRELRAALPALVALAVANVRAGARGDLSRATAETANQTLRDRQTALAALDQQAGEALIALELLTGSNREAWPK